jgi:hypothetical protein
LRASAFAGLGAFALSIIVAIFSRVPFGILLLRALLSGVGFAALIYGAQWVLKRFVPELFDESMPASSGSVDARAGVGSLVDIVLPGGEDDQPSAVLDVGPVVKSESLVTTRAGMAESTRLDLADSVVSGNPVSVDSGELAQEVAALKVDAFVSSDPGSSYADSALGVAPRPSVTLDELDSLPDLDGLSDSFTETVPGNSGSVVGGEAGSDRDASSRMGPSSSMPTAGNPNAGTDPVVLAKAVQTLLRRDQKGQ